MKQRQHTFQSLTIEVLTVLLASTISFPVSDALGMQPSILPFVMVACYVALKLIYHLCLSLSAHIISLASLFRHKPTQSDRQTKDDCALTTAMSAVDNNNFQMKRMELFHYEYQHEERQYLQQKEREEDEKLQAVLQYTRNTFRQFECPILCHQSASSTCKHSHQATRYRYPNLTKELCLEYCFPIQHQPGCHGAIRYADVPRMVCQFNH